MKGRLCLIKEDGEVIENWGWSTNPDDEQADFILPLRKLGKDHLTEAINIAIEEEQANEVTK